MSVTITVRLAESEADALLRVDGRAGWHAKPSIALQRADMKIVQAIAGVHADRERGSDE